MHINLATTYSKDFSKKTLPNVKVIKRYNLKDTLPDIPEGKVAIFVGDHRRFSEILTQAIDEFCKKYNGVVLCDHTSNYRGKYRVLASIVTEQTFYSSLSLEADLVVDIGNVSGAYIGFKGKQVWRVNPDGEIRDTYRKLTGIFDMDESDFFETYNSMAPMVDRQMSYYDEWAMAYKRISEKIPELPFSNLWIAQHTAHCLPDDSILYLAILNTLRSWNFFETPVSVTCYSNTGGFGIDGGVSTLVGMSLVDKNKLYFGVVGDLGFFYDMNVLGNRHIGNNIRIMIINNGRGTEFRNYSHPAACFGEDADPYMAAAGHYGNKSITLVRHYAEDLGFEYLSASNKEEYLEVFERFLTPELTDKSMVLEVFTDSKDESDALKIMHNIEVSSIGTAKKIAKDVLGEKGVEVVKKFLNR